MTLYDYIRRIAFRFVQPDTRVLPVGFDQVSQRLKLGVWFEILNTRLPEHNREMQDRLKEICFIPKMSTYAVGAIINHAVQQMKPGHTFVNIGVWRGFTLLSGMVGNETKCCVGVDNFSEYGGPKDEFFGQFRKYRSRNHQFYEMDYIDYFRCYDGAPIGVFIYDGNHSYENQRRALELAEPYFSDDCIILIDDINYDEVHQATCDFVKHSKQRYHTLFHQETYCNSHPTFWNGITVMQLDRCA